MVIVGGGALKGGHGAALAFAKQFNLVRDGWNGFNVVHMAASRMGGLMLGYAQKGGIADLRDAGVTSSWARTRWISPRSAASRSMSAITAIRARIMPT